MRSLGSGGSGKGGKGVDFRGASVGTSTTLVVEEDNNDKPEGDAKWSQGRRQEDTVQCQT